MARKVKLVKYLKQRERGDKYQTRVKNRCPLCGRTRFYIRYFDMCRICFRDSARKALIPGVKQSSW